MARRKPGAGLVGAKGEGHSCYVLPCLALESAPNRQPSNIESSGEFNVGRSSCSQPDGLSDIAFGQDAARPSQMAAQPALGHRIPHVVCLGSEEKVSGTDAVAHVATVKDGFPPWDGAYEEFIGNTVGKQGLLLPTNTDVAIAIVVLWASPEPAATRRRDVGEKLAAGRQPSARGCLPLRARVTRIRYIIWKVGT